MSTGAKQFRRFVARRERVDWKAGWWKDTGKESKAGCRAWGEQRRTEDIETRTVTDKPSVNYKLLRDVPRLRKASISLNRGADKAVRCTSKRKRLHEEGFSMITQTIATMRVPQKSSPMNSQFHMFKIYKTWEIYLFLLLFI